MADETAEIEQQKALRAALEGLGVNAEAEYVGTEEVGRGRTLYKYLMILTRGAKADPMQWDFWVEPQGHARIKAGTTDLHMDGLTGLLQEASVVRGYGWDIDQWLRSKGLNREYMAPEETATEQRYWRRIEANTRRLEKFFGADALGELTVVASGF